MSKQLAVFSNPLFVGFNHLMKEIEAFHWTFGDSTGFPAHNVLFDKNTNTYTIELAVAGYSENDLSVTVEESNTLVIKGQRSNKQTEGDYTVRQIAARNFQKGFRLADDMEVEAVTFDNGLLSIVVKDNYKPKGPSIEQIPIKRVNAIEAK